MIDDDALFKLVKKAPLSLSPLSLQLLLVKEGRALQIPLRRRKNISPRLARLSEGGRMSQMLLRTGYECLAKSMGVNQDNLAQQYPEGGILLVNLFTHMTSAMGEWSLD